MTHTKSTPIKLQDMSDIIRWFAADPVLFEELLADQQLSAWEAQQACYEG